MIKFLSILHQRCSGTNQCYLLWLWCSVFCCWCSCGSFLLVATTVYDAQNAMAWYVAYQGKEPGVYALKCLIAVLRATNEALKYLGYWLLLWFSRLFWWCLSSSLLSIVVGASNCSYCLWWFQNAMKTCGDNDLVRNYDFWATSHALVNDLLGVLLSCLCY